MINKKILLVGSLSPPTTGVSICNDKILTGYRNEITIQVINTSDAGFSEGIGQFSFKKLFFSLKHYGLLYKILDVDTVYLTIGQTFFGVLKYFPFMILTRIFGKKNIIHLHGNYLLTQYKQLNGFKKELFKLTLKLANKGIVLSENLKENLTPFLPKDHIYVLHNFVDKTLLEITEHQISNTFKNELNILYLSNLMIEKGIYDLLGALKILEEKGIVYKAIIAGNIDNLIRGEVLEKINNLNNVTYIGVVKGKVKKEILVSSNVFVFPTYYKMEGQPIALLEAMATGNIIVTTRHAGIPDIVSENNGYFVHEKSPNEIAEKLLLIKSNLKELLKTGIKNHNYIKKNYTEQFFLSSLKKILIDETRP